MNIKDLIWGIVSLIVGVLGLIWVIKNPSGDENSEDLAYEKQWDIGGYIGARLLKKLPEKILKSAFAIFLIYVAVRMLTAN